MAWAVPTATSDIQRQRREDYDKRRGSSHKRGYGRKWQAYAKRFLKRFPFCACGCNRAAEDVDHIQAVSGPDDPLFWDPSNHQALSKSCHSKKTVLENGGFGRRPGQKTRKLGRNR